MSDFRPYDTFCQISDLIVLFVILLILSDYRSYNPICHITDLTILFVRLPTYTLAPEVDAPFADYEPEGKKESNYPLRNYLENRIDK